MKYKIKKWDLIIISGLFVISFLPYIGIKTIIGTQAESTYAYIAISDELYKEIPLTGQMRQKQIEIENEYGSFRISVIRHDKTKQLYWLRQWNGEVTEFRNIT